MFPVCCMFDYREWNAKIVCFQFSLVLAFAITVRLQYKKNKKKNKQQKQRRAYVDEYSCILYHRILTLTKWVLLGAFVLTCTQFFEQQPKHLFYSMWANNIPNVFVRVRYTSSVWSIAVHYILSYATEARKIDIVFIICEQSTSKIVCMEWSRKQQLNTQRVKTKNPRKKTTKTATITRNPNRMEMQEEQT